MREDSVEGMVSEQQTAAIMLWSDDLLLALNRAARDCMFDWHMVAVCLQTYARDCLQMNVSIISPQMCREQFAAYNQVVFPADLTFDQQVVVEELVPEEKMQDTEENTFARRDTVFKRVLHCLGGKMQGVESYRDSVTSMYHQTLAQKEEVKHQQEARAVELLERQRLQLERELLKKRFESEQGGDSFEEFSVSNKEAADEDGVLLDIDGVMLDFILASPQFEDILTSLEKELNVAEDDGQTELGEILNFLESSETTGEIDEEKDHLLFDDNELKS